MFRVVNDAFPSGTFHFMLGDGIQTFKHSLELFFSYNSGSGAKLSVEPAGGTLILWPQSLRRAFG